MVTRTLPPLDGATTHSPLPHCEYSDRVSKFVLAPTAIDRGSEAGNASTPSWSGRSWLLWLPQIVGDRETSAPDGV